MRKGLAALLVSLVKDAASHLTKLCRDELFRRLETPDRCLGLGIDWPANGLMPLENRQISGLDAEKSRFGRTALQGVLKGARAVRVCIA